MQNRFTHTTAVLSGQSSDEINSWLGFSSQQQHDCSFIGRITNHQHTHTHTHSHALTHTLLLLLLLGQLLSRSLAAVSPAPSEKEFKWFGLSSLQLVINFIVVTYAHIHIVNYGLQTTRIDGCNDTLITKQTVVKYFQPILLLTRRTKAITIWKKCNSTQRRSVQSKRRLVTTTK